MSNKSHSKECESERDGRTRWKFSLPSCAHDQLFVDILMCRVVEKKPCCQLFHLQQLILLIFSLNFWLFLILFQLKFAILWKLTRKSWHRGIFHGSKAGFVFLFSLAASQTSTRAAFYPASDLNSQKLSAWSVAVLLKCKMHQTHTHSHA